MLTDHELLLGTFGSKNLADIDNKQLAKLKEKTHWWRFKVVYNPGNKQKAADTITHCKPLHNMYVNMLDDEEEEDDERDVLQGDLET